MSGICGVVSSDPRDRIDPGTLTRMRDTLRHRGPDDEGLYIGPGVGLGHRRLSIIDLGSKGRQPIVNEDQSVYMVCNGEIYNHAEMRPWLEKRGHRFRSGTDAEVVLHLYEELGTRCVDELRGTFAFAIWDERARRLFLARDRLGEKPLYYRFDGRHLIFASEVKALLAHPSVRTEPDAAGIDQYLTLGYLLGSQSSFSGVKKLAPAHTLIFENARIKERRYWQLNYEPKHKISDEDARGEILARLTESVSIRLASEVPLGAFLSGGVDSSAVVALMSYLGQRHLKTFSIGFKDSGHDETRYARMVADTFNTDHHEFIIDPPNAEEVISDLAWHYDEPYADSSAIPIYYLSKLARPYVTVALNGDAGAENFAGYRRYAIAMLAYHLRNLPAPLRRVIGAGVSAGYSMVASTERLKRRLSLLVDVLGRDWKSVYSGLMTVFDDDEKRLLYTGDFAPHAKLPSLSSLYDESQAADPLDSTLSVDVRSYLPDDLLVKVDRATMAAGLEARSPMLDHQFMEFVARLPARLKMNWREPAGKSIFKSTLRGIVPDPILSRSKMGFGVPLDQWMRRNWQDLLRDVLLSPAASNRGYFHPHRVRTLIDEHLAGTRNRQIQLWSLLMLEMWHRTFIDQSIATSVSPGHSIVPPLCA